MHLLLADAQTQGTYRCDLALEPGVVPEHARLTVRVIAADLKGPTVTEVKAKYRVGERINATCSSGPSSANPSLSWLINDKKPELELTEQRVELARVNTSSSLEVLTKHLALVAEERHFIKGFMRITCIMEIPELGRRTTEKIITRAGTPNLQPENQEEGILLSVPGIVIRGSSFWLNCSLHGARSISWFKDEQEFYRHPVTGASSLSNFSVPGVYVNDALSHEGHVFLDQSDLDTEGTYTCKVKLRNFDMKISEKRLTIYVLPDKGPKIQNLQAAYKIGDTINATCLSGPSRPAPIVTWHLNGKKVDDRELERRQIPTGEGTFYVLARLLVAAEPNHADNRSLLLRCLAQVGSEYASSSEKVVEMLHPQAWAELYGSGSQRVEKDRKSVV